MVFGFVHHSDDGQRFNSAAVMKDGEILGIYNKQNLPNYSVFDEKRYFTTGQQHLIFEYLEHKFGVLICEDIWSLNTVQQLNQLNVDTVLVLNSSPYEVGKPQHRLNTMAKLAKELNLNLVYNNQVGGQDDLIFDGSSFVINRNGDVALRAESFKEEIYYTEFNAENAAYKQQELHLNLIRWLKSIKVWSWEHVTMFNAQGFPGVILGLSGGIDSALTLAIAVDALGADKSSSSDDAIYLYITNQCGRCR